MKTREEIETEHMQRLRAANDRYNAEVIASHKVREAALAELDDPMLRLITAAKKWHDNHWLSFGACSHSVCVDLRAAIADAEQQRAQG